MSLVRVFVRPLITLVPDNLFLLERVCVYVWGRDRMDRSHSSAFSVSNIPSPSVLSVNDLLTRDNRNSVKSAPHLPSTEPTDMYASVPLYSASIQC